MIHVKHFRVLLLVLVTSALLLTGGEIDAKTTEIKVALITPEGSTWTKTLRNMAAEVRKQTGGKVKFKIFSGGVSGDESDVLRKMRVNLIHAAGFSGVGLGIILPKIRILEAPLLFNNYKEIDLVKEKLYDGFAADFSKKGYVLLGFAEAGLVYFFSKIKLSEPNSLKRVKMWVWKGDPVAETFLETFGIKTYPLHVTDVNTGLETGMIDSFYSSALVAIVFQWYSKITYMLDYPMVNSTGAFLIKKRIFDRLSKKNQSILKTAAKKYCNELTRLSRRDNAEAVSELKEAGIEFVSPTKQQIASFEENARKTYKKNMPKLYSRDLFDNVQLTLKEYRLAQ